MNYNSIEFTGSFFSLKQLPPSSVPEIAFAGRSNVGKSSLINCLIRRRNFVKTSSRPGKTQSLNFFYIPESCYLVDLPGYGFARVSRQIRKDWQHLITSYLLERSSLVSVVVIIDLRHELKQMDRELLDWLAANGIHSLPIYTKADKLSGNVRRKNTSALDAALNLKKDERIIFSSKSGQGRQKLHDALANIVERR